MIYINEQGKLSLSKLHEHQRRFIESPYLPTGITGGYQSGKSTVAAIKTIVHLLRFPHVPIAYYLPIYRLFDDMLLPKYNEMFGNIGIAFTYNQQKSKIITPYGEIGRASCRERV